MALTIPSLPNLAGTNVTPNVPVKTLTDTDITVVNQSASLGIGADRQVTLAQLKAFMASKAIAPVAIPVTVTTTWNGSSATLSSSAVLSRSSDGAWRMDLLVTTPIPPVSWGATENARVLVAPATPNDVWTNFYDYHSTPTTSSPPPEVASLHAGASYNTRKGMVGCEFVYWDDATKQLRLTPRRDYDFQYTQWPEIAPANSGDAVSLYFRYSPAGWDTV